MRKILDEHLLTCLVVVLAILLVAVIAAVDMACNRLDALEFFITWLAIGGGGTYLLIRIVDYYELLEIKKYQKLRKEQKKNKTDKHSDDETTTQ